MRAASLADGRLHLQHGPIDLVVAAWGAEGEVAAAYRQAVAAFEGLLEELVAELPVLRRPVGSDTAMPAGPVARRMVAAVLPHRCVYITPMAAVAGAVADEVLARLLAGRDIARAYVNDGGDIAIHLGPGESLRIGVVADLDAPAVEGMAVLTHDMPVRGVATSGRGGRSFSRGIADAVTVLALDAAGADACATLVANAVSIDSPKVTQRPARLLDPDSDLGDIPVTVAVAPLDGAEVAAALAAGAAEAERLRGAGHLAAAMLSLCGAVRLVGSPAGVLGRRA